MEISKKLATQIVDAVYEVVKRDTNLISPSGRIIGSTDPARIGTHHAAGAYAIRSGSPVFVDDAHPFEGSRAGINYPIFLEDRAIAAVGITGDPQVLKPFGFLITKITEVFLKEQQLNQEMLSESRALHYLITSLIHDNIQNQKQLDTLILDYGLVPEQEYAVLSVRLFDASLENALRFYFSSIGCRLSLYLYPNEWVVLFNREQIAQFQHEEFVHRFDGQIAAGLGGFTALYQVSRSYSNALIARKHAQNKNLVFCDIQDISIEFILESIPSDIRNLYASQILHTLSDRELTILSAYLSNDLSLKDTAAQLFIHKNTLQYQLDRIMKKTKLNPRSFQDAFLLQFAIFCQLQKDNTLCY